MTFISRRQRIRKPTRARRWGNPVRRNASRNPRTAATAYPLPYVAREGLLSRGELVFFRVLRRAVANRYSISIKTRLADIIKCPDELWDTPHGRRLSQKHLDFILYDSWTSRIVTAIELDDRSHYRPERRIRDQFIEQALIAGGVALVRIRAAARYDADIISRQIAVAIASKE